MANAMVRGRSVDAGLLKELFRQVDDGTITDEKLKAIVGGTAVYPTLSGKWIEEILARNLKCLLVFGLTVFDRSQSFFRSVLERIGEKQVRIWQKMLFEPVWWPTMSLGPEDDYACFKKKPTWLYEKAAEGKIYRPDENGELVIIDKPYILQEGVYLVDSRCKPYYEYRNKLGRQMWDEDKKFLGWRIKKLRQEGRLAKHDWCDITSRFGLSAVEAEDHLWPIMAAHSDFQVVQAIRSENASEFNFISQCFSFMPRYLKDGETNTSVWFNESFKICDERLCGGISANGGLSSIFCGVASKGWKGGSVRPLAVVALKDS